jgi:hypothetical protein
MDKAQYNLVKTYWRKRDLARKQSSQYDYSLYELKYLLDSGRITSEDLVVPGKPIDDYEPSYGKVHDFLEKYPEYFDKFYTELNLREELSDFYISELIAKHPEYIDKFDVWDLGRSWQGGRYVKTIIDKHPEFINKFNLEHLSAHSLVDIVVDNPKLINNILDKLIAGQQHLHDDEYVRLLNKFPELSDKFEYSFLSASERLKLLWYHPQVIENLFKFYGDNMRKVKSETADVKVNGYLERISFWDLLDRHPELQKYFDNI